MKYAFTLAALAACASASYEYNGYQHDYKFTSIYNITATPEQVVNALGGYATGEPGAKGQFNYAIDSVNDVICYDITLTGVTGDYKSTCETATHIREGAKGKYGPPRITFPDPVQVPGYGYENVRRSVGCLTGPFHTGYKGADNQTDSGYGFKLHRIEEDPSCFYTDTHTNQYLQGVVRGQLDQDYKIIKNDYPYDDGSEITTIAYTKTEEVTVTRCPAYKTYCPGEYYPVITQTQKVYTTACPKSEASYYTTYVEHQTYEKPIYTKVYTPVDTVVYKPVTTAPVDTVIYKPVAASPTVTYAAVTTKQAVEYTGAASANKIGGALFAAGLAAALL